MSRSASSPRAAVVLGLVATLGIGCGTEGGDPAAVTPAAQTPPPDVVFDVHPGDDIQSTLETAARVGAPGVKRVRVHAGTYRPTRPAQALIWFNARHDGLVVEAVGDVVLTAANPDIADPEAPSFPAVVNHVVFFGDGISSNTVLRGFRITGANNFVTRSEEGGTIEPFSVHAELRRNLFFYADGGGIKIFGRSYPTLEGLILEDNYASPCAGGISVEHRGFVDGTVTIRDCIFRDNRCQITGSAIDLLPGSAARIENCLFVENVSNMGEDFVSGRGAEHNKEHGSGALTVFDGSRADVRRCTFTGNWNGIDGKGRGNRYVDSIFWRNDRPGGIAPGARYELDLLDGSGVEGCFINGVTPDLRGTIDASRNVLDAPDPRFDDAFRPRDPAYADVGYRPRGDG
jgi:hypothetical protein